MSLFDSYLDISKSAILEKPSAELSEIERMANKICKTKGKKQAFYYAVTKAAKYFGNINKAKNWAMQINFSEI